MRGLLLLTSCLLLLTSAALARPAREVKVEPRSSGRSYSTPGTEFQNDLRRGWLPQRQLDAHSWQHWYGNAFDRHYRYRPGLSVRYNDGDWSAELHTGWPERWQRGHYRSDYCLYGDAWMTDQYWVGNRPVYVLGDTRGLERRVVTPRRNYGPRYSAPASPAYGYYPADPLLDYRSASPPQVFNDNRVYNYYGSGANEQVGAAEVQPAPSAAPPAADQAAAPVMAGGQRAFGQRFNETLKLDSPDGAYMFAVRDGAIYAGLAEGKPTRLHEQVDAQFGGYAAWLPGSGPCVFYRVGSQLCLGYPSGADARWVHEPLPYEVRFGTDTSIGLVGGLPWLSFNTQDGSRFVVRYTGQGWEELGSATR